MRFDLRQLLFLRRCDDLWIALFLIITFLGPRIETRSPRFVIPTNLRFHIPVFFGSV